MSGAPERRKFARRGASFIVLYRVNSPIEVIMHLGEREINAFAVDIGEGGMSVLTRYELPVPAKVTIRFVLVNEQADRDADRLRSMRLEGEVCYNLQKEEKVYRLGIRFLEIAPEERSFIAKFVNIRT